MANNNRISVVVDISAEASNLTQIINQSKKSLQTLAPNMDPKQAAAFGRQFDNLQNKIDTFKSKLAGGLNSQQAFTKASQDVRKFGDEYNGIIQKIQSLGIDPAKIVPNSAEIKPYTDKLADLMEKQAKVAGERYGKGITDSLNREMKKAAKAGDAKEVEKIGAKASADLAQRKSGLIDKYKEASQFYGTEDPKKAAAKIKKEIALQEKLYDDGRGRKAQQEEASKYGKNLTQLRTDLKTMESYGQYEQDQAAIQKNTQQYAQQATTLNTLQIEIDETTGKINIMAKSARDDTANALNQMGNSTQQAEGQLGSMNKKLDEGANKMGQMVTKAKSMSQLKSYFSYFFSVGTIINYVSRAIRGMINDFKELDQQFNQISIVTGKTMEEMWNTFSSVNKLAQEYGVNTKDVVSVQKLYYQQGRKTAEVNDLTKETLKFAKISGLEFGEATEYMTATLNAYNMSAEESVRITDTFSALAANAAADASEISVAMSKVASLSALSGSTMEETAAYLTKIIETTREGAETAGTALKTIEARFTAINKLSQEQSELLEADYNFNNIEKALKTVGVSVKDSTGNIRGFSEILDDLGPKWDELSSNQQHYIATQAAGARQQSRFIALMNDWGRTAELVGVANESAGTGNRQLALSLDSIETELNKLKANWQEFYTSLMQSSWVKAIVRALNSLLEVLTKIASLDFGWAILLGLGLILKGIIKTAKAAGLAFVKGFKASFTAARKPVEAAEDAEGVTRHYNKGFREGRAYAKGYNFGSGGKGGKVVMGPQPYMGQSLVGYKGAQTGTGIVASAGTTGSKLGTVAGTGVKGIAGAAGSVVGIVLAIVVAIAALITLFDKWQDSIINERYKKKAEEIIEANNKVTEAINNTKKTTSDYTKALKLHQKGLLRTSEETEEYQEALRGLQEEVPQMVQTLEDGTLKLNVASNAYEDYLERQENIIAKYNSAYYGGSSVVGEGVLLSKGGQQAQKNIQNIASSISGMDEDSLKSLGLTGITSEELGKLAETGLTRETINEILNEWNQGDYDAQEFNKLLKRYQETGSVSNGDFAWESYDTGWNWLLGIPGLTGANDKQKDFQNLLDTLNELAGYDVVSELIKANDPDEIRKVQVTNWTDMYDAQKGTTTSEYTQNAFSGLLKRSDVYPDEFNLEEFYDFVIEKYGEDDETKLTASHAKDLVGSYYNEEGSSYTDDFNAKGLYHGNLFDQWDYLSQMFIETGLTEENWFGADRADMDLLTDYVTDKGYEIKTYEDLLGILDEVPDLSDDFKETIKEFSSGLVNESQARIERYYAQNSQDALNNIEAVYARLTSSATLSELQKLSKDNIDKEYLAQLGFSGATDETVEVINAAIDNAWTDMESKISLFQQTIKTATGEELSDDEALKYSVEQMEAYLPQVKRVASEYGKTAAAEFWKQYDAYNTDVLKDIPDEFRSAFAQVDFTDAASISSYAAKLLATFDDGVAKAKVFFDVVNEGVNIADVSFKDAANQLTDLTAKLEKMKKIIESVNKSDSALSFESAAEILNSTSINAEDFLVTSEGLTLSLEDRQKVMKETLQTKLYELVVEKALLETELSRIDSASTKLDRYEELNNKLKEGNMSEYELAEYMELQGEIEKDSALTQLWAKRQSLKETESMLDAAQKEIEVMSYYVDEVQEKKIEQLEELIDLLGSIDEYADVDNLIETLGQKINKADFYIEFTSNADVFSKNVKDKFNALNNSISANMAKSQHAEGNVATMQENFAKNWGKYISFDEYGNLMQDEAALIDWANEIATWNTSTEQGKIEKESQQKQFELLMEQIDAYRTEHKLIEDCTDAANKHLQEVEALTKELRENVVELEDTFFDLFVKRDEEILANLEERYDKMKEMDDEYLDSVRDAIEEERRLRDQNKEYDDVAQMERKLALLQMSGGSAVEIQQLQEQIKEARQSIADTEQDNILDGIEKENEARAAAMDEEVTYQQAVLEQKKEDRRLYNEEIKALMSQDKETIMNAWKELDKEWAAATEENKKLMGQNMDALVLKGTESATLLADTEIQKIEAAFTEVKTAGIDTVDSAMDTYVTTVSTGSKGIVSDIDTIEQAYIGVKGVLTEITGLQDKLLSAEKLKEIKKIVLEMDIPENINPDAFGGGNDKLSPKTIKTSAKFGGETWYQLSDGDWYRGDWLSGTTVGESTDFIMENKDFKGIKTVAKNTLSAEGSGDKGVQFDIDKINKLLWDSDTTITGRDQNNEKMENLNSGYLSLTGGYSKDLINGSRLYEVIDYDTLDANDLYYITQGDLNTALGTENDTQWYKLIPGMVALDKDEMINVKDDPYISILYDQAKKRLRKESYNSSSYEGSKKYLTGGIVDYTGPAWVDGTKTRPEAFLSANDTQLIASLRDILRAGVSPSAFAATSLQKSGDTYYTIHINVDELGDGYSVDDLVEEMEERILQATGNTNVVKLTR